MPPVSQRQYDSQPGVDVSFSATPTPKLPLKPRYCARTVETASTRHTDISDGSFMNIRRSINGPKSHKKVSPRPLCGALSGCHRCSEQLERAKMSAIAIDVSSVHMLT